MEKKQSERAQGMEKEFLSLSAFTDKGFVRSCLSFLSCKAKDLIRFLPEHSSNHNLVTHLPTPFQ